MRCSVSSQRAEIQKSPMNWFCFTMFLGLLLDGWRYEWRQQSDWPVTRKNSLADNWIKKYESKVTLLYCYSYNSKTIHWPSKSRRIQSFHTGHNSSLFAVCGQCSRVIRLGAIAEVRYNQRKLYMLSIGTCINVSDAYELVILSIWIQRNTTMYTSTRKGNDEKADCLFRPCAFRITLPPEALQACLLLTGKFKKPFRNTVAEG